MNFSKTTEYALRIMAFMADDEKKLYIHLCKINKQQFGGFLKLQTYQLDNVTFFSFYFNFCENFYLLYDE